MDAILRLTIDAGAPTRRKRHASNGMETPDRFARLGYASSLREQNETHRCPFAGKLIVAEGNCSNSQRAFSPSIRVKPSSRIREGTDLRAALRSDRPVRFAIFSVTPNQLLLESTACSEYYVKLV